MLLALILTIYGIIRKMMSTFMFVTIAVILFNIYIGALHLEGLVHPIDTTETMNLLKKKSIKLLDDTIIATSTVAAQVLNPAPQPWPEQPTQPEAVAVTADSSVAPLTVRNDVRNDVMKDVPNTVLDTVIDKVAASTMSKVEKSIEAAVVANKPALPDKAVSQLESFDMAEIVAMNQIEGFVEENDDGFCDYDSE